MSIRKSIGRFLMYLVQPTLAPMLNEIIAHQNITMSRLDLLEAKANKPKQKSV